jgi:hypothetical protein
MDCIVLVVLADRLLCAQLQALRRKLVALAEENAGSSILFVWIEFIRTELLAFLGWLGKLAGCENQSNPAGISDQLVLSTGRQHSNPVSRQTSHNIDECAASPSLHQVSMLSAASKSLSAASAAAGVAEGAVDTPVRAAHAAAKIGPTLGQLSRQLQQYSTERGEKAFRDAFFECEVCLESKKGADCVKFTVCGHVFCRSCMDGYTTSRIVEGDVQDMICPKSGRV